MSELPEYDLSIVVAWQQSQPNLLDCLDSLFSQKCSSKFEVIVVYGGFTPSVGELKSKYPLLKVLEHPQCGSIPSLHGLGVAASTGKLIAITEAHTTFASNWIDTAVSISGKQPDAAIGGAVEPGKFLSSVDFALYLCDYAQFALPLAADVADDLPGNNIVFKRGAIDKYLSGKDLERDGFWKTFFCNELIKNGERLSRSPDLVAYYNRHLSFGEVMNRRYHHGRCFGAMRCEGFDAARRAFYSASCAALPMVLSVRLFNKVKQKPALMGRFVLVQPICQAILSAWIYGEFVGTVSGAGDSCERL
ncbi:MAG TPA: glycosyltransferase [Drouetiella sp.]|jgi:Glycosyl transferase family 2